uniref:E3 ubiquitin-protein ligase hrd-1 n=1 Tax=Meloidogyne hapla TaxID=6305 RepID=A0A1I8C231_MELHA
MVRVTVSFVVIGSFISTVLAVMNAFFLKKQFYPSVVYLTKSSTSMTVLYFQAAVFSYLIFSFIRWIFFGQLRPAEVERAQERVWHAIMETCLAFTVFRDDFSPKFVVQFVVLFFVKAFHWLSEDRVDYMERSPVITLLFHARILGIISLLGAIDSYFISHAFFTTLMRGASAQIVFGFEYAVLLTMVAHITINYLLHLHDLRSPHPWEKKAVYMLYVELFTSFLRCVLYLAFAVVMMKIHTFPLFAIRPFYLTVKSFRKAVNDVILSRRAINAMNNLFPLATAQDLAESDNTCIICREEMTVESGVKKLPCNHIFHPNCLRSWFQRQQTCPTCRTDVLAATRRPNGLLPGHQQQQPGVMNGMPANMFQAPFHFQFQFGGAQQQRPQQQQPTPFAQQQQQQQIPPFMPFGFPMFPPQFFPPMQQQQQQQHPAQRQTETQGNGVAGGGSGPGISTNGPSSSTASSSQQNEANSQGGNANQNQQSSQLPQSPGTSQQNNHQSQPPPPFFNPFMLSGLNDAELAAMEGVERRAVEARIQTLRNIQVLLDAAMLQFQQYLTAFSTTGANPIQTAETSTNGQSSSIPNDAGCSNECPSSSSGNEKIGETSKTKEEATTMPEALNQEL